MTYHTDLWQVSQDGESLEVTGKKEGAARCIFCTLDLISAKKPQKTKKQLSKMSEDRI